MPCSHGGGVVVVVVDVGVVVVVLVAVVGGVVEVVVVVDVEDILTVDVWMRFEGVVCVWVCHQCTD